MSETVVFGKGHVARGGGANCSPVPGSGRAVAEIVMDGTRTVRAAFIARPPVPVS